MILSVIIPIYNVEKDLEHCLKSIISQIDNNIKVEVILVNDGSTDKSEDIAKEFTKKFNFVSYIFQENQGLSVARNVGFNKSVGEYVWFVDSDDWISNNSISLIIETIKNNSPEVIMVGLAEYLTNNSNPVKKFIPRNYSNGISVLKSDDYFVGAVVYIMKRTFLNDYDLEFYKGIYHEDEEFINRMLYFAKRIATMETIIYCVNVREGSITRTFNTKKSFDLLIVIKQLNDFTIKVGENDLYYKRIGLLFNNAIYNISNATSEEKKLFNKIYREQFGFVKKYLFRSNKLAYKLEGLLLYLPFSRPTVVYKFLSIFK